MGRRESIQDEEIAQGGLWQSEAGDWMDHALVKVILDIFFSLSCAKRRENAAETSREILAARRTPPPQFWILPRRSSLIPANFCLRKAEPCLHRLPKL